MKNFLNLFKKYPDYALLTVGGFMSAVGISFTAIAIYSELERLGASPELFSLAFVLESVPGIIGAGIANKYFKNARLDFALAGAEALGALLMILPIIGACTGSLTLLMVAGVIGSLTVGFMIPYHKTHMRRVIRDEDLPAATFLSNHVFALTFILGTVGGTWLYQYLGPVKFFFLDALSYFVSAALCLSAAKLRPHHFVPNVEDEVKVSSLQLLKQMNTTQRRAFWLNALLIVNCVPTTSLLPSIAVQHESQWKLWGWVGVSLSMTLLMCKTLGQILGPALVEKLAINELLKKAWVVPASILLFQGIYIYIFSSTQLSWVFVALILAHVASNVLFILGFYSMIRFFEENEIARYSTLSHQTSILLLLLSSIWAAWVAKNYGVQSVAIVAFAVGIISSLAYMMFEFQNKEKSHVYSS